MKAIATLLMAATFTMNVAAVDLKSEGRDADYVKSIVGRSEKITNTMNLPESTAKDVTNIIANRYFKLNDIYSERDSAIKTAKDSLEGSAKNTAIQAARDHADSQLYRCHFEFDSDLSLFLTPEQIDKVKDGMTFGVLPKTYEAHLDMIPSLTDEEKSQIYAWLKEARELAIDAESSNKKHEVFGKYKGRINNYLSARGYDLVKEREGWYERVKARGGQL